MFDVEHCPPLHTLTRVKEPLANRSEIKTHVVNLRGSVVENERILLGLCSHGTGVLADLDPPRFGPPFADFDPPQLVKTYAVE